MAAPDPQHNNWPPGRGKITANPGGGETQTWASAWAICGFVSVRARVPLRNWEQDRVQPDGPGLALLRIAARHPRIVRENVNSAA